MSQEVFTLGGSSGFGASSSAPRAAPLRLQNALKALGQLRGDPTLTKVQVDGVIGSKTVAAVNYAIAQKYVVMRDFPRPDLTLQHVRQFSAGLAAAVEGAVKSGGGTFPTIPSGAGSSRSRSAPPAALAPIETADVDGGHKWVWYVVGGASLLVVLALVTSAVRGKKRQAEA